MDQVHGTNVVEVHSPTTDTTATDAIITKQPHLHLVVRAADCVPLLLHDSVSGYIGAVHAGRRGTQSGILKKVAKIFKAKQKAVQNQTDEESSLANKQGSTLHAWFGPHICHDCYQIDRETDLHYDLQQENLNQLYSVFDTDEVKVAFDGRCTKCDNDQLYSYRGDGAGTPMNYVVIGYK